MQFKPLLFKGRLYFLTFQVQGAAGSWGQPPPTGLKERGHLRGPALPPPPFLYSELDQRVWPLGEYSVYGKKPFPLFHS